MQLKINTSDAMSTFMHCRTYVHYKGLKKNVHAQISKLAQFSRYRTTDNVKASNRKLIQNHTKTALHNSALKDMMMAYEDRYSYTETKQTTNGLPKILSNIRYYTVRFHA